MAENSTLLFAAKQGAGVSPEGGNGEPCLRRQESILRRKAREKRMVFSKAVGKERPLLSDAPVVLLRGLEKKRKKDDK